MPIKKGKKIFRQVAVEGETIDGREITRKDIEEMAQTYDPKVYGARIWPEHFRGFFPGGAGDALGDIHELHAEVINDGSDLDGKMALYAHGKALPKLTEMHSAGQKVYSSIEMFRNFAGKGKAYFFGIAATDTPASLGTEILAFSQGQGVELSKSIETVLTFGEEETEEDKGPSLFSKVQALLTGKSKSDQKRFSNVDESVIAIAESQQETIESMEAMETENETKFSDLQTKFNQLQAEHKNLVTKLSGQPGGEERPPASGGDGHVQTDC